MTTATSPAAIRTEAGRRHHPCHLPPGLRQPLFDGTGCSTLHRRSSSTAISPCRIGDGSCPIDTYRRLYLETNSPYRFVELNFKHLLGRAPRDQAEISEHVSRLADEGFEAEIASYTYSEEYLNNFGIDTVPYARTATTVVGESTVAYQRNKAMDPGFAGFDGDQASVLRVSVASRTNPTAYGARKVVGGGKLFNISWTSRVQLGTARRSAQRSVVSYGSLSKTIKSIQAQGGRILTIANA